MDHLVVCHSVTCCYTYLKEKSDAEISSNTHTHTQKKRRDHVYINTTIILRMLRYIKERGRAIF